VTTRLGRPMALPRRCGVRIQRSWHIIRGELSAAGCPRQLKRPNVQRTPPRLRHIVVGLVGDTLDLIVEGGGKKILARLWARDQERPPNGEIRI
jgi:hypothetical protein